MAFDVAFASIISPEEEAMNALLRKKRKWEYRNERYLLKLVETSADVSVESVKKAGRLTSFLLYLVYRILGGVLAIAFATFIGPKLIRATAPGELPEEVTTPEYQLEAQIKKPLAWR
jgi:hypothetical protein